MFRVAASFLAAKIFNVVKAIEIFQRWEVLIAFTAVWRVRVSRYFLYIMKCIGVLIACLAKLGVQGKLGEPSLMIINGVGFLIESLYINRKSLLFPYRSLSLTCVYPPFLKVLALINKKNQKTLWVYSYLLDITGFYGVAKVLKYFKNKMTLKFCYAYCFIFRNYKGHSPWSLLQ